MKIKAIDLALSYLRDGTLTIDDQGRIWRNYVRDRWGGRKPITPRRAENPKRKGYLAVTMGVPGERRTCMVLAHVLVWTWIHGPVPEGMQINHKDLDKANNEPSNLEIVTASGNIRHSYENGRPRPWRQTGGPWRPGKPRLTDAQKDEVVSLYLSGLGSHRISKQTGISKTHVERIIKQKGVAR